MRAEKIRIIFLVYRLHTGGAERQLLALASGLDRDRFDIHVVSIHGGGGLESDAREAGIPHISLNKVSGRGNLRLIMDLRSTLRSLKPDVVYSFTDFPNVLNQLGRVLGQRYATVWGLRSSDNHPAHRNRTWRAVLAVSRKLAHFANGMVSNSSAGRDYYVGLGYPAEKIHVIPNGIDTDRFQRQQEIRRQFREQHELQDTTVIAFLGRISPKKDTKLFLEAANRVARNNSSVRFIVAGEDVGQYAAQTRKIAQPLIESGHLHWLGLRDDPEVIFNAADIFALTSSFGEGSPNSLAEAMACECACTSTDVGDATAILGSERWIVPVGDIAGTVLNWQELISMTPQARELLGKAHRRRIQEEFSLERMITQSGDLIGRLADAR